MDRCTGLFFCLALLPGVNCDPQSPAGGPPVERDILKQEPAPPAQPAAIRPRQPRPDPPALPSPDRVQEYESPVAKSVLELQQFRRSETASVSTGRGETGTATLIHLNPRINRWMVLGLEWGEGPAAFYHVENARPSGQKVFLGPMGGLGIETGGKREECSLWENSQLAEAAGSGFVYAPICDGRLYLRNPTKGNKTSIEWATDFLRHYVWGGERITGFVRNTFYQDSQLSTSEIFPADSPGTAQPRTRPPGAPVPPRIQAAFEGRYLVPADLGITLETPEEQVLVGRWYPVDGLRGIYVSAIQPGLVAREVIEAQGDLVSPLDEVESSALVFLVGFDLARFEVGFALGTDHPALGWSPRVPAQMVEPELPGPDGIDTAQPLVRTGKLSPAAATRAAATFVGGFKRYHGAFRYGDFAFRNSGSHYGFIESGAVLSKLQPGLATALVLEDGTVELKTWTEEDNSRLGSIRHARQNGLPLLEPDPGSGAPRPGLLVAQPRLGNWSGSVDGRYRTVRSGICLQTNGEHRFLLYGYFSSATASAMARVFQAYGCGYAMLLDINALEHTYLAVYRSQGSQLSVEQLVKGMQVLEKSSQNRVLPRFVGYADNRDFFYMLRKEGS